MNLSGNTVLVTGGSNGIGLAIAERFLMAGSEVIICGRSEAKLKEAKHKYPKLHTHVCDVGKEKDRIALADWAAKHFPKLNVLVNNAGIQRRPILVNNAESWSAIKEEIDINIDGPIHLSLLFIPHLQKVQDAYIMNVTSGLAFAPLANVPVYSATKAALHSFTLSLRHSLVKTTIKVVEIIPPAVQTDLGGKGLHDFGVPLDEFADSIMKDIAKGDLEVSHGFSAKSSKASRAELDELFKNMNSHG